MNTIKEENNILLKSNNVKNTIINDKDLEIYSEIFKLDKNIIKHFYSSMNKSVSEYIRKYIDVYNLNNFNKINYNINKTVKENNNELKYYNMFVELLEKNKIIFKLIVSGIPITNINADITNSIEIIFNTFKYSSISQLIHDRINVVKFNKEKYDITLFILLSLLMNNFDFRCIKETSTCADNFYPLLNRLILENQEEDLNIFKKHLYFIVQN